MFRKSALVLSIFAALVASLLFLIFLPKPASAQMTCTFVPVSTPLTDLGSNEYYRLTTFNPPTYQPTGFIGGLYPFGSNLRPIIHEAAGVNLASQITPRDSSGAPNPNGKIGLVSVGMSNTSTEFARFIQLASADSDVNDKLILVNGAVSGATIEQWIDSSSPNYTYIWNSLEQDITQAGMVDAQIQVVWIKITQLEKSSFPGNMQHFETRLEELTKLLKTKFPNLKITYLSSRTRSYAYTPGAIAEPASFDNAFAVRWLIEKQINGDISLNYDPNLGPTPVSYLSWGPYLWIDGMNPRLDGRIWPVTNLTGDCVHPTANGDQAVAEMLMEFFKTDSTTISWFLNSGVPTPTPTPTETTTPTPSPSPSPTDTPTPTLTPTPTPSDSPTPTPTPTLTPTSTPTPTPTPPQGGGGSLISSWSFPINNVADDLNSCFGCSNNGASWFTPSIVSGGYIFNGSTSSLNLGSFPYLDAKNAFSVAVWIKPTFNQSESSFRYVFNDGSNLQLFFLPSADDWRVAVRNASGTTYRLDTLSVSWLPDSWHLLGVTYGEGSLKIYWDGALSSSMAITGPVSTMGNMTTLGMSAVGGSYFSGAIDELKIYDYALNAGEVYSLFVIP